MMALVQEEICWVVTCRRVVGTFWINANLTGKDQVMPGIAYNDRGFWMPIIYDKTQAKAFAYWDNAKFLLFGSALCQQWKTASFTVQGIISWEF